MPVSLTEFERPHAGEKRLCRARPLPLRCLLFFIGHNHDPSRNACITYAPWNMTLFYLCGSMFVKCLDKNTAGSAAGGGICSRSLAGR